MAENPIPVLGILGGVASGKSTVARLLAARGAAVIDADRIAHEVLNLPHVKRELRDAFGEAICAQDGTICRSALAREVFVDVRRLEVLNGIVHPIIIARVRQKIGEIRRKGEAPMVALDAALLMETGLHEELCDALLFVDAPGEVRAERARSSRGWSSEKFLARGGAQIDPDVKKERADFVVDNSLGVKQLERTVRDVWKDIMRRFHAEGSAAGSYGLRETAE